MKRFIFSILIFFLFDGFLQASDSLSISNLSIDQGLSNNSVRCIYQDHNGFIWFGTYDGLNRYDGYQFKIFRNKLNDTNSLPHNYIYTIQEDKQNNLWVGTGQGIGIFNNLRSKFSSAYYVPWQENRRVKITVNTNVIKADAVGNMFIGTNGLGLLIQKVNTDFAEQIPFDDVSGKMFSCNIQSCFIDKKGKVWLFLGDIGLCSYNYATNKIELENTTLKNGYCMQNDGNGILWIGSNNGLYRYTIGSKGLIKAYDMAGSLSSNIVESLSLDQNQNLWLGTEGGGIDILDIKKGNFSYILPGEDKGMLSSESVFSIYQDREMRTWIGTLKGGINIIEPSKKRFQSFEHNPLKLNSLIYNFVSSFYEDKNQDLLIGTDGGGMSNWNRKTDHFTNFRHDAKNPQSLSSNLISSIHQDYMGNYWIATYGGGINKFNKAAGSFTHYKCIDTITGEENKNAWLLYEDKERTLWATTFSRGRVYRYNRQLDRFDMFDSDLTDIISLTQDASGKMWAGNFHQLIQMGTQGEKHVHYEIGKPIRAIYEDAKGNLWLGTEGCGLVLFDKKQGKVTARYSDVDGLCNNSVLNIVEDNNGNLWLSTFNGLSRFNIKNKSFKNYFKGDGLQSNQFLYNAALRLRSGELVFGGIKGFTIFNPDSLTSHNKMPSVFITSLMVNNRPIKADSNYVTKNDGSIIQELKIPFDEAVLSIDFAALEYSMPDKISYAYFLEGWDKDWNYSGTLRSVNYTHLKEGTFKLYIKNTDADGEWSAKQMILKIIVLPPWYRSWWAYLIYCAMAFSVVYIYLRYKTSQTRLEYEVKIAHLETEKEKELNEKKLAFFTEMSHEFRTPLTLIINPIKDMIRSENQREHAESLNIVYRNASRLLSLIDQLLLFRKADTEGNKLKITKINYTNLCKEVYLCFSQEAYKRNVAYIFNCPDEVYIYGDRQKIEIALYNLLSNAIKYTPVGGFIHLDVTENDLETITSVKDSGPGIPQIAGDRIFDKFYQSIDKGSVLKPGFGIGLYLAKNVTESHHGTIGYQTEEGKGTTFILTLLKGKDQFIHEFVGNVEEESVPITLGSQLCAINHEPEKCEEVVTPERTLLIIDDNEQMRNYIISIFSDRYMIFSADNGEEGLRIAKEQLPDLIISDIVMEKMNGMELCNTIKKDSSLGHIPVILLTGSASPEGRLKGIEFGADDYITKPFEKDLLVARVISLLKNKSVLQNYFYNEITLQKNSLNVSEEYKVFLDKCISIVEAHIDDDKFNIQILASEIGMSHSNLYKKVKSISGQSVNSFIRFIRLRKAAELFIHTNQNVNETAYQVGMGNVKYFREQFNKLFGINPSEYIKKYRKAFGNSYRLNKDILKGESTR